MEETLRLKPDLDHYMPAIGTIRRSEAMTDHDRFFEIELESGVPLGHMPGQFVMVSIAGVGEAPISISSAPGHGSSFDIIVRNAGNVTGALHRLAPGDRIGVRGPFGTWFPVDTEMKGKDIIFAGGGLGLVPLRSVINYVLERRDDYGQLHIYYGAKCPTERLCTNEVDEWQERGDVCCLQTVDRGDENWTGQVGVITTLMTDLSVDPHRTVALLCGPPVMFKFVIAALRKAGMVDNCVWVSLERHMKCGVGKCGHCQINQLYVCQDGPVFRFDRIEEVPEALQ